MKELQIFKSEEFGEIRTVEQGGQGAVLRKRYCGGFRI